MAIFLCPVYATVYTYTVKMRILLLLYDVESYFIF